jgi:adenylate cyclase
MKQRDLFALTVCAAVIALLTLVRGTDPGPLQVLRNSGFDGLQRWWPREVADPMPVRVVDIDEASLATIGQWPWPRSTLANLTQRLFDLGAGTVAFDIVFPEADRMSPRRIVSAMRDSGATLPAGLNEAGLPDNDEIFARAISGQPVVMAFAAAKDGAAKTPVLKAGFAQTGMDATAAAPRLTTAVTNLPALDMAASGIGGININLARDQGLTRQISLVWSDGTRLYPALALEALRVAQGEQTIVLNNSADQADTIETVRVGAFELPVSESGNFYLYYRPDAHDLYVSAQDVLNPAKADELRSRIDGAIVFVGTSAVGLLDVRTSALGQAIPGVSVHAQAVEQALSGAYLVRPEWAAGAEMLGTAIVSFLLAAFATYVRPRSALAVYGLLSLAAVALSAFSFRHFGLLLDATYPLLAMTAIFLASIAFRLLVTERAGRQLRGAFAHYVAPGVLAEIERNPAALRLGGEMRDITVMFVDIENFTPLSEKLEPVSLVSVVNRILDAGSAAILAERGTIDKYIGDAIMAFWNAPLPLAEHQYHAAKAALAVRKAVAALNDEADMAALLTAKGAPRIAVRIGIASGPACVGNMGSSSRFDYSAIGETVNTAARTESACKDVGFGIAVSGEMTEKTRALATLPCGALPMKGRSKREAVHILVGDETMAKSHAFQSMETAITQLANAMAGDEAASNKTGHEAVLAELADQHPELASFFERLPKRLDDYRQLIRQ